MSLNFAIAKTPEIHFGAGKLSVLSQKLKKGSLVLLCTGDKSFSGTSMESQITGIFNESVIKFKQVTISGEPTTAQIDAICNENRGNKIDFVIAIGGGSVLDAGKAISAMLTVDDSVFNYLEDVGNKSHPGTKIPMIAIPTTAGTGSEVTKNAVICDRTKGYKKSLRHDHFVPEIAIVDPELTLNCPAQVTAQSGLDALSQLIESYTSTRANAFTDAIALDAIKRLMKVLPKVLENGSDLAARTEVAYASMISGITLANVGLGLIHGFASTLGGMYTIPHGLVCGTLMGIVNQLMLEESIKQENNSCIEKYARIVSNSEITASNKMELARQFISQLQELVALLPNSQLRNYRVLKNDFPTIIKDVSHKNNPVVLSNEQLIEILEKRW